MKALSLWQPWATLIVIGAKEWETRGWFMSHRGLLAIHAAKHTGPDIEAMCSQGYFKSVLEQLSLRYADLPRGKMLGIVDVKECRPVENLPELTPMERAFGDYRSGRFATRLKVSSIFAVPIPAIGRQGLFQWKQDADGQETLFG